MTNEAAKYMQLKFIVPICLIGIILTSFKTESFTIDLTGRLKKRPGNDSQEIGHITVFVKGKNQILGKARSNSKGVFHLSWNDNNAKAFYFYCVIHKDTLLLAKISKFESDTPDLTFLLPDKGNSAGLLPVIKTARPAWLVVRV